jgi:hypothetical protein
MKTHPRLILMPLPRHLSTPLPIYQGNIRKGRQISKSSKGIRNSEYIACPLGCVGVLSCTYHGQHSLFSDKPSYIPKGSKFCRSACSCEKDFSMKVKNEMLSLITAYGRRKNPAFSNSVCHPSVEEMI